MSGRGFERSQLEGLSKGELLARVQEAEETIAAIRDGEVDAVVVGGPAGQQVYTLENADRPYRVLIEQMQEGAVTLGTDGTILYANQRFANITCTKREALLGQLIGQFLVAEDEAAFMRLMAQDQSHGRDGDLTLRAMDGAEIPVNISLVNLPAEQGELPVICCVVTDLTNSRRRSHELAAANARLAAEIVERQLVEASLQLALDSAGMGNWDLDLNTGAARCSPRHDEIFGHPGGAPLWTLQSALEHFVAEDLSRVREAFAQAETSGVLNFEARINRRNDGAVRDLHVEARTYLIDNRPARIAGVVRDVTDRRLMEEQLRQSQKMEAIGQLTGGLAHDFNNLLGGISGSLQLLNKRLSAGRADGLDRYISAALDSTHRASALTQRLLAFARRQTLDPKVVDVNRTVAGMTDMLQRSVGPDVHIEAVQAAGIWGAKLDPSQLENAVLNLCINARDAMAPQGGRITIETANKWLDPRAAKERQLPPGQYVSLCISDTGSGMSADVIEKVFDPFFTTKPLGQGTGLGLSMVYGFARQSGGQVRIYSELGKGTTMCLYFPRFAGAIEDEEQFYDVAIDRGDGETVLIIDDEPAIRMVVAEILSDSGYHVVEAVDGPSGLAVLDKIARIDLLITDVGLPGGLNGRQVADAARIKRPKLKVLFITGFAENAVVGNGHLDAGMSVITKPFEMTALANKVRELIDN